VAGGDYGDDGQACGGQALTEPVYAESRAIHSRCPEAAKPQQKPDSSLARWSCEQKMKLN
jgi:hypothetical protein